MQYFTLFLNVYLKIHFSFSRACKSLQNLTLTIDVKEHPLAKNDEKYPEGTTFYDYSDWGYFPPKTMKSFVLQHTNGNDSIKLDKHMKIALAEIVKRSARNLGLRCFWTSIHYDYIDANLFVEFRHFNLNEMIACNHSYIPVYSPAIESCVIDWVDTFVNRRPVDFPSQLKQIECLYERKVSYWTFVIIMFVF